MVQHGNKSACLAWLRRVGAPLFLAVLFFLGLFATAGYGMPFDEKEEQAILNANMREYILRFCGAEALPDADTGVPFRLKDRDGVTRLSLAPGSVLTNGRARLKSVTA